MSPLSKTALVAGVALGFVVSRVLEAAGILAGVPCLLAIISLTSAGIRTQVSRDG